VGQILGAFPDTTRYDVPSLPVMQSEISDFAILFSNGIHSSMLLPSRRRIEPKVTGPRSEIASAKRAVQNRPLLPIKFGPGRSPAGRSDNDVEADDRTSPLDTRGGRHAKKFEIVAVPRHGRGVTHGQRAAALDDGIGGRP
jgi:hypothetical protein